MDNDRITTAAPRIRSIGVYVPAKRASNLEKAAEFGFAPDFLETKLGIRQRAIKEPDETTSDLCMRAVDDLRSRTHVDSETIDLVAVVTQNPDLKIPHTAAIVHNRLGLKKDCMTFDISQGCAGYCHAIAIAVGVMETVQLKQALLFTCDPYSSIVNPSNKDVALLFGDAATVTYLTRAGKGYELLDANFGTLPESHQCLRFRDELEMDGAAVFNNSVKNVPGSIFTLLERNGLSTSDVDCFLMHQGSKYLLEFIRGRMGVPAEKAPFAATDYGNTVSSSIPLVLQKYVAACRLEVLVLSGFGVGFSWGNNLLELSRSEA